MVKILGRKPEIKILKRALQSEKSELIALYGRRRVGKTFLIREFFKNNLVFEVIGLFNGSMHDQLINFQKELKKRRKVKNPETPTTWLQAFTLLEEYLDTLKGKRKKVVFIDEFPWMATARSKFMMAFENFWNSYCLKRTDLIVVICGSAASFMVKNVIRNKGGLHNRITQKIRLLPFNLHETDLFLKSKGIAYTDYDTIQVYMVMGGVPHYLDKLEKGLSMAQNIDELCFTKDGVLLDEFDDLYSSLFDNSEKHLAIISSLAKYNKGVTRKELLKMTKIPSGGDFTIKLNELIESGFVSSGSYYQNKKQLTIYRLSDEYSKFYLKFILGNKDGGTGTWQRLCKSQSYISWAGFAFETICLKHILQLKKALRIDAIYSRNRSWFNENAQIDLLIDRDDQVINLCEMKFHKSAFAVDKKFYLNLKNKIAEFQRETATRKNIFLTIITTYGINRNKYSNELVQNEVEMRALFKE
jgi:AAA+ ATPase superfamily predicted ATPase